MKTSICLLLGAAGLAVSNQSLPAQASYGAQAYAAQQQEEERWRKLSSQMDELANTTEVLRKRIQTLEEENRALRSELGRKAEGAVSPEEFNRAMKEVADKLKELDTKRIADNKTLREEVERLVKNLKVPSGGGSPSTTTRTQPSSQQGYTHAIQEGETISAVVAQFRAQGVRVSVDDVIKANPGLDPRRLSVGQEIFIPKPQ